MHIKNLPFFFVFIGIVSFFNSHNINAQTVILTSDKDSISVGVIIHLNVKVQLNEEVDEILFPDSSFFPNELLLLNVEQFTLTDFSDSLSYKVQYFSNQDVFIPSFPIALVSQNDTSFLYSNSLQLTYRSVLPNDEAELNPIKPILEFSSFPWGLVFLILIIVGAGIWAYLTFRKKEIVQEIPIKTQEVPFINPLEHLEKTLIALKIEYNLAQTKDYKYFYSTISDSIREYYEELYQIPALESTTREVLRYLDAFGVDNEMTQRTRSILNRSDMVKFAKFEPSLEGAWDTHSDAQDFIERAKLIDASRIARKKTDHDNTWLNANTADLNNDEDTSKGE